MASEKSSNSESDSEQNRQWYGVHEKKDELSSSVEEYAETIYRLSLMDDTADGWVTNSAISEKLKVSAPSTTKMLKRMQGMGLIEWKPRIAVKLTVTGVEVARKIIRNHLIIKLFFNYILDLPESEQLDDVICKVEHDLSDCVIDSIQALIGANEIDSKLDSLISEKIIFSKDLIKPVFSYDQLREMFRIMTKLKHVEIGYNR